MENNEEMIWYCNQKQKILEVIRFDRSSNRNNFIS